MQAKVVSILQGGHIKLSHPSLRPKLYLSPGDKGYVGSSAASGESGASEPLAEGERQVRSVNVEIGIAIVSFVCCR